MATDVIMPALGVAQEKGTLLNWLKAEGQSVTKGEPLMEVETDKATVEIEAPASGILTNVTASVEMKFQSEIESRSSWRRAKRQLRRRFRTLTLALSQRERE